MEFNLKNSNEDFKEFDERNRSETSWSLIKKIALNFMEFNLKNCNQDFMEFN